MVGVPLVITDWGIFISDMFFQHQINQLGEKNAIIAWTHTDMKVKQKSGF